MEHKYETVNNSLKEVNHLSNVGSQFHPMKTRSKKS